MGSQVLVPFRGSEDSHRHLKLMGDLGQVWSYYCFFLVQTVNHFNGFHFLLFVITYTSLLFTMEILSCWFLQIVPMKYNPRDEDSIKAVMAKANVVINLIGNFCLMSNGVSCELSFTWWLIMFAGREYETRNYSFEEVNHSMAEQLAMVSFCMLSKQIK